MNKFKVALVGLDNHIVPQWVYNEIRRYKISFLAKECTTKADLIKNANDADVVWLFGGSRILNKNNLSIGQFLLSIGLSLYYFFKCISTFFIIFKLIKT